MFKFLFHLVTICFIFNEIMWIVNPKQKVKNRKKFKKMSKEHKGKSWDDYSEGFKDVLIQVGLPSIIFLIWMVLGVLTFNWVLFLAMLIFNLSVLLPIQKLMPKFGTGYTILHWLNSIVGFVFGVFVLINSYHLKIDLFEIVKSWF